VHSIHIHKIIDPPEIVKADQFLNRDNIRPGKWATLETLEALTKLAMMYHGCCTILFPRQKSLVSLVQVPALERFVLAWKSLAVTEKVIET
jgi:hypothetical protein